MSENLEKIFLSNLDRWEIFQNFLSYDLLKTPLTEEENLKPFIHSFQSFPFFQASKIEQKSTLMPHPMSMLEWIRLIGNKNKIKEFIENSLYFLSTKENHHQTRAFFLFETAKNPESNLFIRFSVLFNFLDQNSWGNTEVLIPELKEFQVGFKQNKIFEKIELYIKTNRLKIEDITRFKALEKQDLTIVNSLSEDLNLEILEELCKNFGIKYVLKSFVDIFRQNKNQKFLHLFFLYKNILFFDSLQVFHLLSYTCLSKPKWKIQISLFDIQVETSKSSLVSKIIKERDD